MKNKIRRRTVLTLLTGIFRRIRVKGRFARLAAELESLAHVFWLELGNFLIHVHPADRILSNVCFPSLTSLRQGFFFEPFEGLWRGNAILDPIFVLISF